MYYVLLPFSMLLKLLYTVFNSYGIALIAFAVIVKLILFPFNLKGKRSMIQMNLLNSKMQQLQKQYGKDRQRYQIEVQKLYDKEHVNPMGGCLWSLIPMIVLFALYYVIREPLTYMMHMTKEMVEIAANTTGIAQEGVYYQIYIAQALSDSGMFQSVSSALSAQGYDVTSLFQIDYTTFGLDLSTAPEWKFWVVGSFTWAYIGKFLIPIVSAATGLLSSMISMRTNKINNTAASGNSQTKTQADMMQRQMLIMMPLMSLFFAFWMPAGLGVYWIANNLLMGVQETICGRLLKKDYERAAIARAEQERMEKEQEKRRREEKIALREKQAAEAKEARKKGLTVKKEKVEKKKDSTNEAGRIGHRAYARGRSYDPDRYPPTVYRDPGAPPAPVEEKAAEETAAAPETAGENTAAAVEATVENPAPAGDTAGEEATGHKDENDQ